MATNIDKFVEPGELPAGTGVPLGGIIMWMNPAAASMNPTPPVGYEFCDGTVVGTGGSPFLGQTKPNLMVTSAGGALGMARGADVNSAPYGVGTAIVTGGADTHAHGGSTSSAGNHNHGMQNHNHSMQSHTHSTTTSGSHGHGFTGTANQSGVPATGGSYQGGAFFHNHSVGTGSSTHSHGNTGLPSTPSTGAGNPNTTDSQGNHGHSISSDAQSNVSLFSAVAFIMRVL